jgi:hypothetical protein
LPHWGGSRRTRGGEVNLRFDGSPLGWQYRFIHLSTEGQAQQAG